MKADPPAPAASARRLRLPRTALVAVLVLVVGGGLMVLAFATTGRAARAAQTAKAVEREAGGLRATGIVHENSLHLAAATGEQVYARRHYAAEPTLRRSMDRLLVLAGTAPARTAFTRATATEAARGILEDRALALARAGKLTEALAIVSSGEYTDLDAQWTAEVSDGIDAVSREADARASSASRLAAIAGVGGAAVLALFGAMMVALARSREREVAERRRAEREGAERRKAERRYAASQRELVEALQATVSENEAYDIVVRHVERIVPGAHCSVLRRNNSENRLEVVSGELDEELAQTTRVAAPSDCAAIRLGHARLSRPGASEPLMPCNVCGELPGERLCVPSLVGGEVVGSVLVRADEGLDEIAERRLDETAAQAAPVLANLRTLAIAESRAMTDLLTGLPNRRAAEETLRRMAAEAGRRLSPLSLVMFDLDHFKQVNDLFGHEKGDEVLAATGHAIRTSTRASDFAARFGGEEFLILLPDTDAGGGMVVAEHLRQAVERISVTGVTMPLSASFGVASLPDDAPDPSALVRAADRALYAAKEAGRNRVLSIGGAEAVGSWHDREIAALDRPEDER